MTSRDRINEFFNGRQFMTLCAVTLVAVAAAAIVSGLQQAESHGSGIFYILGDSLIANGTLSAIFNVLCVLATGSMIIAVNKVFGFVRSVTFVHVSAFYLLMAANPAGLITFNAGTLLCLATVLLLVPLFGSFQDKHAQRFIFFTFMLIATGAMFHYAFVVLIPVMVMGFTYMHALNTRGILAMLIGIVTPFWIVLGLRIASPGDAHSPAMLWASASVTLIAQAATIALVAVILAVFNLFTIINYRMQPRIYNVCFFIMLVAVIIAMAIAWRDLQAFMPLLSLITAVQVAQFHTVRVKFEHRYILMMLFVAACVGNAIYTLAS